MKILPNGIAVLDHDTHISKWVEEHGRLDFDRWMLEIVEKLIKPGDWVVDAGAYIGDHTLAYARKAGQTGLVIAFEPNPVAYECLCFNMTTLAHKEAIVVDVQNKGLSNDSGKIPLIQSENVGASHLELDLGYNEGVEVIALDDLYLEKLDFFKMDIEGYEHKALIGAKKTILKYRPIIFMEINKGALNSNGSSYYDIKEYMEDVLGYRKLRFLPEITDPGTEPQFDVIFAHP